ncbi:MAG: PqqD family peptide modification chaperone [Methanobacteriota archaeon]
MFTKLIFPPQWIPTQPYLSLPSLTAFLKANGCDVEQMDVNVSFYDDLLSKQGMQGFYERTNTKFQELESRNELPPDIQKKYTILGGSMLFSEYIIDRVDAAKKVMRDKESFYDAEELFEAFKILELCLKLASSAYYPTNLTFHAYDMRYSCRSSKDLLRAINDHEENLFIDYYEKTTLPKILKDKPGLVGISIINTSQLIPGLTLANLIKKADRNIHINIGGSVFTRLVNEISCNEALFSVFDSVIVHEGETALLSLVKHLYNEFDITDIPNLIYKGAAGIRVNKINPQGEDINSLPTPCFDGLPLEKYFSPELVLPVLSSRGCYWRRCTFCDHSFGYSGHYRHRDVDLLYNDLKNLKTRYKTQFFTFQDEGISSKLLGALSEKIIENNLDISWLADSRFEPAFSAQLSKKIAYAGCRMLYFGLESANERILKCMDKGIKKEIVLNICKYTTDAGIWTHLFLIFGFPTETRDEAMETMDFILQNANMINSMSFGSFQLTKHSKVYENPAMFGVSKIKEDENIDLSLWYDHETSCGMSKKETDEMIQEFYRKLSLRYRDLQLWSNLDREHLFLYISHYKRSDRVPELSKLIDEVYDRKKNNAPVTGNEPYPSLMDGVFVDVFNFNLAKLIHIFMAGETLGSSIKKERTNVVFDTGNNRIFTVTDFAMYILGGCDGRLSIPEIIEAISKKFQMPYAEAGSRCIALLDSFAEKKIIGYSRSR